MVAVGRLAFIALLLAALLPAACSEPRSAPAGAPAEVTDDVAAALDAANAGFSAAWMAADIDAILATYDDEAVLHPPAGGVLATPDARRGLWVSLGESDRVGHRIEPTLRELLGPGLVLEMGRWHSSVRADGEAPWLTGCYTVIWRHGDDNGWRMSYDGWTAPNDASWACRPR